VVFVHAKPQEEKFLAEGFGVKRYPVMYNDFIIVGPKSDPAGIGGMHDAVAALRKIVDGKNIFVSRAGETKVQLNVNETILRRSPEELAKTFQETLA